MPYILVDIPYAGSCGRVPTFMTTYRGIPVLFIALKYVIFKIPHPFENVMVCSETYNFGNALGSQNTRDIIMCSVKFLQGYDGASRVPI